MKTVKILQPFDGHMPGDEVEFHGHLARQMIADGRAEEIPADSAEAEPSKAGIKRSPRRKGA